MLLLRFSFYLLDYFFLCFAFVGSNGINTSFEKWATWTTAGKYQEVKSIRSILHVFQASHFALPLQFAGLVGWGVGVVWGQATG